MKPQISIIANFYKSCKFIPKLLRSVANQTFTDWELIAIDDCSPDNDYKILEKHANRLGIIDKTRIIRNNTNLGITDAKHAGILHASGEYMTFIDGDDWFAPQALEQMFNAIKKHDCDMVIMNHYRSIFTYNKPIPALIPSSDYNRILEYNEFMPKYYINFYGVNIFNQAYWGKLYKSSLVKKINFSIPQKEYSWGEDSMFHVFLWPTLTSICFIDYYGYHWRWGGLSSGRKNALFTTNRLIDTYINYLYPERNKVLHDIEYKKTCPLAPKFHDIELKNVAFEAITSIIGDNKITKTDKKKFISQIITMENFSNISKLGQYGNSFGNEPFVRAWINKDIDEIYAICLSRHNSRRKRKLILNLLRKIMEHI